MKKFNLMDYEVTIENSFKKVEISQIKKVHSKDYINKVLQLSKEVNHRNTTLPFTPCLKSILQQEEKEDGGEEASDPLENLVRFRFFFSYFSLPSPLLPRAQKKNRSRPRRTRWPRGASRRRTRASTRRW